MGEDRAGLGDDAVQPGEERTESGRERGGDQHGPGRRILRVVGHPTAPDPAAGAGSAVHLSVVLGGDGLAQVRDLEPGGERRAEVVEVGLDERRDRPRPGG